MGQILATSLQGEMQRSYLEYAMSVIVGRALPDVRDGLKPVHRRILFAMHELGLQPDRPFRKCARVVGDVLGKYHPHGDTAVYDTLVRLAQDFSCRYPLIEGHGNFGSLDNDPPAAMRYTECRLAPVTADILLQDVNEPIVPFQGNFDDSCQEPMVLPARLPMLLLNGANGIAVGMTTNIPPHNLGELVDAVVALIDQPEISLDALMTHLPGPDFPTAGEIVGSDALKEIYRTGRGSLTLRGLVELETLRERSRSKQALVIRELPYQVSIEALTLKIAELVNEERLQGVSDLRNESNRAGIRIVIELKKEANPDLIIQQLYRYTPLQENFNVIQLALVNGQPQQCSLIELLQHFLDFRLETLTRRITNDLEQVQHKVHLLEGSQRVLEVLPQVVTLLLAAEDSAAAQKAIQTQFDLSPIQAEHILQMPLRRLTRLDRRHLTEELARGQKQVQEFMVLLEDRKKLLHFLKKELLALKKKFNDPRRTRLTQAAPLLTPVEELIVDNPWVVVQTLTGHLRRQAPSRKARPEEALAVHSGRSFWDLLAVTTTGRAYRVKFHAIPEGKVKGTLVGNLLNTQDPLLMTLALENYSPEQFWVLLSAQGRIKRIAVQDLADLTGRGLGLMRLAAEDRLVSLIPALPNHQLLAATSSGRLVRFPDNEAQVPSAGLATGGVQGFPLRRGETMVGLLAVKPDAQVVLVTRSGYAKTLPVKEVRLTERSVMGTVGLTFAQKTDSLLAIAPAQQQYIGVTNSDRLLSVTEIPNTPRTSPGQLLFPLTAEESLVRLIVAPF